MEVTRFDVFLVSLYPTVGSEIRKSRPAVIVSPDELNRHLNTVIIAPLTSTVKGYPTRVEVTFESRRGEIALDQIRTIDRKRLKKKLGKVDKRVTDKICDVLVRLFSR